MSPDRKSVPAAVERVREYLRRRVMLAAVLWGTAGLWAVLALAWLLAGPGGWQQGSATPLLLDIAILALAAGLAVLVVRGTRRWLQDVPLARIMESSAGLDDGTVEGTLQLARELPPGVSPSLSALAQRSVAERLNLPDARLSGAFGARASEWVKRGSTTLALVTPLILLLLVSEPARSKDAWLGLGRPFSLLARPTLPPLAVSPGTVEVLRASPVDVVVSAAGRTEVTLHWQAAGDVAHTEKVATVNGEARFHFPSVTSAIEYSAADPDGAESDVFRITPVDPLLVNEVVVELTFPAYTGRPSEEYREDIPPLEIPIGTRIHIEGRVTLPLTEARLERNGDGLRVPLESAGLGFTGNWTPTQGGLYEWRFTDRGGRGAEMTPPPIDLRVVPDSAPTIRFTFPAVDTILPLNLHQPLIIEVRDDYGVGAMELVAYRVTSLGERMEPVVQRTELGGSRAVLARPLMDLSSWGLLPGDTVRYFARAVDIAPSPRATTSREYVLIMPEVSDLRRNAQDELEAAASRLQQISDRVKRAAEANRDKQRERQPTAGQRPAPPNNKSAFEQKEEIQRALAEQQAMSEATDSARAQMEVIAEALREAGASDPTIQQKMDELNALLEEAAASELRETLQAMSEGLDSASNQPQNTKALEELLKQQEKLKTQLNAAVEMMQRAIVDQAFESTMQDAIELAAKERALGDAMREGGQLQLRQSQQQDLRHEAKKLDANMDLLNERLKTLKENDAIRGVNRAKTQSAESQQAMQSAQEALPNQEASAEQAEQAAENLDQAARELQEARDDMSSKRAQALQDAIDRVGEEALQLSRRQSDIQQRIRGADAEQMKVLIGDETSVSQGLANVREKLVAEDAELSPAVIEIMTQMGNALYALDQALTFMDSPRAGANVQQSIDAAVIALNQMALVAITAHETGSGEEGEGNQLMRQLQELAQAQAQLNNQAAQLAPMELGAEAMQKQLDQLAADEEQIAAELQQLAQEADKEADVLGDVGGLAREAMELAGQLAGGRLDAATRERQEKLFHRLLDAGRTLEREEFNDDRESRVPGTFERGDVLPLGADALGALRYALPTAEQLQRLTPAERELVLRYFDRLNRGPGAPPSAPSVPSDPAAVPNPAPTAPQREQQR